MPFSTYAELKTAVQNALDNNNPNLIAAIPDMIALGEAWMRRHLHTREMECRSTTPLLPDGVADEDKGIYDLPADWGGHRTVERRTDNLVILYWRKLASLSDSNTSNWVLEKHPDLYYSASLAHSEAWLKNDPRVALWAQSSIQIIKEIEEHDVHDRYSGGPIRVRTERAAPWRGCAVRLEYLPPFDFFDLEGSDFIGDSDHPGYFTVAEDKIRIWPKP